MRPTEWDLADRMRKALRHSGMRVGDVADAMELSRNTVSAWLNGRHRPRLRDLRQFAALTGYDLAWLETGQMAEVAAA